MRVTGEFILRWVFSSVLSFVFFFQINARQTKGLIKDIIINTSDNFSDFPIVNTTGESAAILYSNYDYKGVVRAILDLQNDIENVTGVRPGIFTKENSIKYKIIIGTLGKSNFIDRLVSSKHINVTDIQGKWESFLITTIDNPNTSKEKYLVIAGSDKRGTIYGIYELSHQLGVSPWYWWADVPVKKRPSAYVLAGHYSSGEPKVRYRGIFINDEMPCMDNWAKEKFGGMNSKMYAHVFELLLRLRANCIWPGMWGSFKEYKPLVTELTDEDGNYVGHSFNEDDPENPRLADEFGIIVGTSHHEPMQRSQQEWLRNRYNYGNGEWNYVSNKDGIVQFFREGIENTKDYECIITMGMRGDEDRPMVDAGSAAANFRIMEGIIKDQREIIENVTGKPASEIPQVWTLYKEVLEYYDQGMKVPDDMIIVLCDDNWGNVRRLPELNEKKHPGGYGMYFHVGYYGAPRASKWLNISQISQIWEQLQLTYSYGVDKLWILNVGDLKPNEYPMDFFLEMAWDPTSFNENNLHDYARKFCDDKFGATEATEAADILDTYCKFNSRISPEMLNHKTYNLENGEFLMVKDAYMALEARALRQYIKLKDEYKDTYKQLVLFPVQAMANLYEMYYAVAMNKKQYAENDLKANYWANRVKYCFNRDTELTADYHNIANGKWNHMMDQVHIGYQSWHAPEYNIIPKTNRVTIENPKRGGYIFNEKNGVVVIEAEHFFESIATESTYWTIIPDMGRTLSGVALMPYNMSTRGAELKYKINMEPNADSIRVQFFFDSTLPFKKGGHSISVSFIGGKEKIWNINKDLTWENCYTKMYPAGAARMNEFSLTLELPESKDGSYVLSIHPLDPGMVLYKIVVDNGGYENSRLKLQESIYTKIKF